MNKSGIISLEGFMGCGKSSIAVELASLTGRELTDLDEQIEKRSGRSIGEIFREGGEPAFRNIEKECLKAVLDEMEKSGSKYILSLGGGTPLTHECASLIKGNTTCIYLRCSIDELVANIELTGTEKRPLLEGCADLKAEITRLMSERSGIYEGIADFILDVDGLSYKESAGTILTALSL